MQVDLLPLVAAGSDPEQVLQRAQALLGAGELSQRTREYVLGQLRELPDKRVQKQPELVAVRAVGLLLGAPELQRR